MVEFNKDEDIEILYYDDPVPEISVTKERPIKVSTTSILNRETIAATTATSITTSVPVSTVNTSTRQ